MDAVRYIEERARMCKEYDYCKGCQINKARENTTCQYWSTLHPKDAVAIVEKWSAENRVTLKGDFLKRCPNAELNCANEPIVCAKSVYGAAVANCDSYRSCSDCWNRPLSEVE